MATSVPRWLVLVLGLLAVTVCGGMAAPVRVVSLAPSLTEMVYRLGQGQCLVGRSSACDYPAAVKTVPVVGGFGAPAMEKLAAVRPQVVLVAGLKEQNQLSVMASLGVKVLVLPSRTLSDYPEAIRQIGDALGCRTEAAAEIERFNRAVAAFRLAAERVPLERRPRVYLELWPRSSITCGNRSFLHEMIECAGGVNIAGSEPREYFKCSEEWILARNPDIIISPAMGAGQAGRFAERSGWRDVKAVERHRVYTHLDQSLIFRLGPRTTDGIALLKRCLDGDPVKP